MKNKQLANIFDQMADLLEILGQDPFRINSYRRISRVIAELPEDQRGLVIKQMYVALDAYQRTWTSREIKHDWPKDLKRVSANMLNSPEYFIWRNPKW